MACFRLFNCRLINTVMIKQTSSELLLCGRTTCIGSTNFRGNSIIDRKFASYEGDGKTVAYVMDKRRVVTLAVKSCSPDGFKLHNDMQIVGSAIVFPYALFSWNVRSIQDVTEDSLTMFKIMVPKLDLLIFGYGKYDEYTSERRIYFSNLFKKLGIRYEALPTEQAIGTYNFLAEDFRHVAGAFIPPYEIDDLKLKKTLTLVDKYDDDEDEVEEPKQIEPSQRSSDRKLIK